MPATKCRVSILGVEIDALTMDETIIVFERLIARRRPALVYNVNVDVCMKIKRDPSLQPIYKAADLVLADGTPMTFAARFLQTPLPGRVSGSDLVPAFCRIATLRGYRVFFLGAAPGWQKERVDCCRHETQASTLRERTLPPRGSRVTQKRTSVRSTL